MRSEEQGTAAAGGLPVGPPLSPVRKSGQMVFISGQTGTDPATGVLPAGLEDQTRQALANIDVLLAREGLTKNNVAKVTVYLTAPSDYETVNRIYREHFSEPFPARTTVSVSLVGPEYRIEIDAIALAEQLDGPAGQ